MLVLIRWVLKVLDSELTALRHSLELGIKDISTELLDMRCKLDDDVA